MKNKKRDTKTKGAARQGESLCVELRAAEGGQDAKALVELQSKIYAKYCERERL